MPEMHSEHRQRVSRIIEGGRLSELQPLMDSGSSAEEAFVRKAIDGLTPEDAERAAATTEKGANHDLLMTLRSKNMRTVLRALELLFEQGHHHEVEQAAKLYSESEKGVGPREKAEKLLSGASKKDVDNALHRFAGDRENTAASLRAIIEFAENEETQKYARKKMPKRKSTQRVQV